MPGNFRGIKSNGIFLNSGLVLAALSLFSLGPAFAASETRKDPGAGVSIVPNPASFQKMSGVFRLEPETRISVESASEEVLAIAAGLAEKLRKSTGYPLEIASGKVQKPKSAIVLKLREDLKALGREGYSLTAAKNGVRIESSEPAGLFYGVQSLYQLLPADIEKEGPVGAKVWTIPCLKISDQPRFSWRGVQLDVARHFFPKDFIKKIIDLAAYHKLNVFHWHLTDDQGWRLEIKKYPRLTDFGAWRKETMDDGRIHGGFYTQDDIREIIAYAKSRYVTVVPEIEMPGHSQAATAAYPELSCTGGPFNVGTEWGVMNNVFCAGNDKTFEFAESVLGEVMDIFPSEFIHVGGDEVPKLRWQNCIKCRERIRAEGLKDENELQSWFIRRIENFLNAKGRRLIGWDEILEGGLAPNATVMSWRGIEGGIAAARSGHDAVMSPTSHCYFDYYQGKFDEPRAIGGFLPTEKVYSYEPVPDGLKPEEAKHILGAQANLWTEYIAESRHAEYMLFPRLCALAEVVWTPKAKRSMPDFNRRMLAHYDRLAAKDANFRVPPPEGAGGRSVIFTPVQVTLENALPNAVVRYTLDGSDPAPDSPIYSKPLEIGESLILKARTFMPNGLMSHPVTTIFDVVDPEANGLAYSYYEGEWERMPDFSGLSPVKTGVFYDLSLEAVQARPDHFGLVIEGFLQVDQAGEYAFTTSADEACRFYIDDQEAVPYWGPAWLRQRTGTISLQAGKHPVKLLYFEDQGSQRLEIYMEGPGMPKQILPPRLLFRK